MKQKYEEVKSKLSELLSKFKTFQNEASHFHSLLHSHIKNKELVKILPAEIDNLITQLNNELETQNIIKDKIDKLNLSIHQLHESLKLQNTQKPFFFFFQKIFKTNSYQKWNESNQFYLEQLQLISKEKSILRNENEIIDKEITSLNIKINKTQHTLSEVTNNIKTYIVIRNKLLVSYAFEKENLVDDDFYSLTLDKMHLSNPYSSIKLNRLRSEIFTTSLEVHKYAILAHSKYFRNNLETFFSVLSGKTKVEKKIAIQLWDTFFFCVPVVSTTLASVSRLFSAHGKENLGWLLLDEAGQATPQSAAGIIWRSKRCIIVGDPLQIEPVVTIPENLVKHLRLQNKVDDLTWSPLVSSVQMLADRISKLGTYMTQSNSDSKIWTGFPLRTHRRCIDPMFKIANEIAYSNQMVKAIEDSKDVLESSKWLNVEGTGISNKHVVKEELVLLKEKILELRKNNYNDQIFVISPFKSIANACNSLVGNLKNVSCGTIHTFQGKEANIVFLILGSDPVSSGARAWASKTPNMLNVALTRAKKRIYVIGNKSLWGKCDHFKIMTKYL